MESLVDEAGERYPSRPSAVFFKLDRYVQQVEK